MAAPTPWTARAVNSHEADWARPPISEANGEQGDAGHEDPPPAEDVTGPGPEEQEPAEGQGVGVLHPGEPGRREVRERGGCRAER